MQQRLYDARTSEEVQERFMAALGRIEKARALILGIPSDVGAGFVRGANLGPQALRQALLADDPDWPRRTRDLGIVDIGDVFCVPQLLHDEMLSEAQLASTRAALYPSLSPEDRARMAVSPLSMAERALELCFALNPNVKPILLGGDHSTAWPAVAALARARGTGFAIVQVDAHTDLLAERLGVRYCFATWSYHANELLGRGGRLIQVGLRASRFDRAHWESSLGVRQFWADECLRAPEATLDAIVDHLRGLGSPAVYFSNDIDGTDEGFADATGTPEPAGLLPELVVALVRRLGRETGLLGGDLMEVAPTIHRTTGGRERTLATGVRYLRATIEAALAQPT